MASQRHNSDPALKETIDRFHDCMGRAHQANAKSLEDYRNAGAALRLIKQLCKHGDFLGIVKDGGCSRAWAARLMKLDAEWSLFENAKLNLLDNGSAVVFSVESALNLIKRYKAGYKPDQDKKVDRPKETLAERELKAKLASAKAAAQKLEKDLAVANAAAKTFDNRLTAAKARIVFLEAQIPPVIFDHPPEALDQKTRETIEKVSRHWFRGASSAERENAIGRIEAIGRRKGWRFPDLTAACGVEL